MTSISAQPCTLTMTEQTVPSAAVMRKQFCAAVVPAGARLAYEQTQPNNNKKPIVVWQVWVVLYAKP